MCACRGGMWGGELKSLRGVEEEEEEGHIGNSTLLCKVPSRHVLASSLLCSGTQYTEVILVTVHSRLSDSAGQTATNVS